MTDEVCEECGSDVIYRTVETTQITSTARTYMNVPERCSNQSCEYWHGASITGFTVARSEWEAAHPS